MAAQAYMEWMPIRQGTITGEGVVEVTSITQIIEWGELATVVAVDTRLTARSKEPSVFDTFSKFADFAMNETDVASYYNESSPARQRIDEIAEEVRAIQTNPKYTMIGENLRNLVSACVNRMRNPNLLLTKSETTSWAPPSIDFGYLRGFERGREAVANFCPSCRYGALLVYKF
jgi:hypothetical protein